MLPLLLIAVGLGHFLYGVAWLPGAAINVYGSQKQPANAKQLLRGVGIAEVDGVQNSGDFVHAGLR